MAEPKDKWDKFDIVSKFTVSVAIALIAGLYTCSQNNLEKQRQAKSNEVETLSKFMPYLSGTDQPAKQAALLAMRRISSTEFMTQIAQLYPSAGAVGALRAVIDLPSATTDERRLASDALTATKQRISNLGSPPDGFLHELVAWGKVAPNEIFAADDSKDSEGIYATVEKTLGPSREPLHRRAVMLEVMSVLAGFESNWNWNAGPDVSDVSSGDPKLASAGAWQVNASSVNFGPELKSLLLSRVGTVDPVDFQRSMKADHSLAMEYVARLLRRTTHFSGPLISHKIDGWLSRDAVSEFESLIGDGQNENPKEPKPNVSNTIPPPEQATNAKPK